MHRLLATTLGTAALLVTTILAAPDASWASAAVPFHATFTGTAAITGPYTTAFAGTGLATHLGSITTDGHVQITGIDNTSCQGGVANTNTEILTAANGDTLVITSADVACPVAPNRYHGSGRWLVTGGTGRFGHASGSGTFDGHSDFGAGTFDTTLTGRIAFDA